MAKEGSQLPDLDPFHTLFNLRKQKGVTLEQMADLCGLSGKQSRKTVGEWEQGESVPRPTRATDIRNYLLDGLGLREDPETFQKLWESLVLKWGWEWKPSWDRVADDAPAPSTASNGTEAARTEAPPPSPKILPPPAPAHPPQPGDFIGRTEELVYFSEKLQTIRLAVITGMAGVGKTALAARLARGKGDPNKVFWHSFHKEEGVDSLIWRMAGFLAWHGRDALWQTLQGLQQSAGQRPPAEMLCDYLLNLVQGGDYLLCLDDFHWVEEDPALN
jgi:transcriptional regulator with XRE-family HTH domain